MDAVDRLLIAFRICHTYCLVSDCWAANQDGQTKMGIYTLEPENAGVPFLGFCDEDGWTVIQRRFKDEQEDPNAVSFYR